MNLPPKRILDIALISDIHLGTYGCHAKELLGYLKSIDPKILILNGDIVDIWQFSKRYFPKDHFKVIRKIIKMLNEGTEVYYLTGNHDELLRRFSDTELGNFHLLDKLILTIDGTRMWFFHGDIFDITMKHSKWLARLGGWGYDMLIVINQMVNFVSEKIFHQGKFSFSKHVKDGVKKAIKFINDFEQTAIDLGIEQGFDYVACGHIHQPNIKTYTDPNGKSIVYLNSGDWIENLTALEYTNQQWTIFKYDTNAKKSEQENEQQNDDENL